MKSIKTQADAPGLFSQTTASTEMPLAHRLTPVDLNEWVGQSHLLGPGKLLRRILESDQLSSAIFFGPPGCGKSALARLMARRSQAVVEQLNAVMVGVADVRKVIEDAKLRRQLEGRRTLLILDEIHRFNKGQQDALLPDVERGTITLIGLTSHNPSFYVNDALVSRAPIFEFKPHTDEDLSMLIDRALLDPEKGYGKENIRLTPEARKHLIQSANGDARRLLNSLELAVVSSRSELLPEVEITLEIAEACLQKRAVRYDRDGDAHYDIISAFIKSMRGGDPDAAVYWMARMLSAGEDPRFIARRILIAASEDVGNADPQALIVAQAAFSALEYLGMPEARIPLAQAAIYVACAPKSNASYLAIDAAWKEAESGPQYDVPNHLKDGTKDRESLGHGVGYLYPHDFPDHFVPQLYNPTGRRFYEPTDLGYEISMKRNLDKWMSQKKTHNALPSN